MVVQVHVKTLAETLLPHFAPRLAASAESEMGMAALGVEFASALLRGDIDDGSSEGALSEQVNDECDVSPAMHARASACQLICHSEMLMQGCCCLQLTNAAFANFRNALI